MDITNINPNSAVKQASKSYGSDQLDQDSFMRLLLAQMQMQDPLEPFDSSTMMEQISQLTSLNATQQMADSVELLKATMSSSQVLDAAQIVGKSVQIATDSIQLPETGGANGAVLVPKGVDHVQVSITDTDGKVIRTLNLDAPSDGVLDFTWDGLDESGVAAAPGFYKMSATSKVGSQESQLATAGTFKVNSVALDRASGTVILNVDGLGGVSLNDVVKIL